eukprot:TRINITY_DN49388_c0_g1_i1.p1 TRINITY_DN49388_c0_g1~~TRINITY_DN49388_c0_g1_i1.p1  ORF type:complete len:687 (-),score=146.82 TRINITY_DN49388_c0_g1_i1:68-2128(-)
MAGAGDDLPPDDEALFDPFSAAEAAGQSVIDQVLTEGGKLLYDHYIARKAFAFAAGSICEALVSELKMSYVRHDDGEPSGREQSGTVTQPPQDAVARQGSFDEEARRSGSAPLGSPPEGDVRSEPAVAATMKIPDTSAAAEQPPAPDPSIDAPIPAEEGPPASGMSKDWSRASMFEEDLGNSIELNIQAPRAGWTLESEPARCRIDTWARACVPIRKKIVRHHASLAEDANKSGRRAGSSLTKRSASRASVSSASVPGSRSPSRFGAHGSIGEEGFEAARVAQGKGPIPLADEGEEDEDEALLREQKDREARKLREDQLRAERKALEESEDAAKLAQVKDDKKNKQFTYDTDGNVIWVQPPLVHKLPATNPAPLFSYKQDKEEVGPAAPPVDPKKPANKTPRRAGGAAKRKAAPEFKDGFKKFPSQQPAMIEAMTMTPGVELTERNKSKKADKAPESSGTMTRKEYKDMTERGEVNPGPGLPDPVLESRAASTAGLPTDGPAKDDEVSQGAVGLAPVEEERALSAAAREISPAPSAPSRLAGAPAVNETMKIVRTEMGADLIPHPPSTPRPVQPAPPSTARRFQSKRDALGFALSTREKVPTTLASRFPNCAAQPPLGATMGHGLLPKENKYEEYYFPDSVQIGLGSVMDGLGEVSPLLPPKAPSVNQGLIVSKNPQLKSRLFGKA